MKIATEQIIYSIWADSIESNKSFDCDYLAPYDLDAIAQPTINESMCIFPHIMRLDKFVSHSFVSRW